MPDSILVLQLEHKKIGKVLGLMKQQLAQMQAGLPVDHLLLDTAMEYLSGFPEQCHHPKEDLLYGKLISRVPALAGPFRDLRAEHEDLAHLTRELRQALSDARLLTDDAGAALALTLQEFLDFYGLHMLMEEQHFFPMALEHLSRDDFDEIDFTLYEQLDSALSQDAEDSFARLLTAIASMGNLDESDAAFREDAAWLSGIHDLASFGAAMAAKGEPVKLAQNPRGGYTLVRDGQAVLRIPHCDEARAAWCACYFLKGAGTIGAMSEERSAD